MTPQNYLSDPWLILYESKNYSNGFKLSLDYGWNPSLVFTHRLGVTATYMMKNTRILNCLAKSPPETMPDATLGTYELAKMLKSIIDNFLLIYIRKKYYIGKMSATNDSVFDPP